jgi:hypothetical protein
MPHRVIRLIRFGATYLLSSFCVSFVFFSINKELLFATCEQDDMLSL